MSKEKRIGKVIVQIKMVQDDNTNIVPIGNTTVIGIQDDSTNLCTGVLESNTVCWVLFVGYAKSGIRARSCWKRSKYSWDSVIEQNSRDLEFIDEV